MSQTQLVESGAARLLQDINVHLNIDVPDPERVLFEAFQPYYARFRYLELAEALVEAYRCLSSPAAKQKIMHDALGALARCADQPLGIARSLVVIDFVFAVGPEYFEQSLWHRLFFRYESLEQMPRWSGALLLRWCTWNVHVKFTPPERQRVIQVVEPSRFECAVTYLFKTVASHSREPAEVELKRIRDSAMSRLRQQASPFLDEELDTMQLEEVVYQLCDEVDVIPSDNNDTERVAVEASLAANWGETETMIGFGSLDAEEDIYEELAL